MTHSYGAHQLEGRRKSLGMSYQALADHGGVSPSTVRRLLKVTENALTLPTFLAVINALEMDARLGERVELRERSSAQEYKERRAPQKTLVSRTVLDEVESLETLGDDDLARLIDSL